MFHRKDLKVRMKCYDLLKYILNTTRNNQFCFNSHGLKKSNALRFEVSTMMKIQVMVF